MLNLPNDNLIYILNTYIEIKDLIKFDTSLCNIHLRNQLKCYVYNYLTVNIKNISQKILAYNWFCKNNICYNINIKSNFISNLKLFKNIISKQNLVISLCVYLCSNTEIINITSDILKNNTNLKTIIIHTMSYYFLNYINTNANKYKNLEIIEFNLCSFVSKTEILILNKFENLKKLIIKDTRSLIFINVCECINLVTLQLECNELQTLNLSNNKNIKILILHCDKLEKIIFTQFDNLHYAVINCKLLNTDIINKCSGLTYLYFFNSIIESLTINLLNLQELDICCEQLTRLELINNNNIKNLTLKCDNITEFYYTKFNNLLLLQIYKNLLKSITIINMLNINTNLVHLKIYHSWKDISKLDLTNLNNLNLLILNCDMDEDNHLKIVNLNNCKKIKIISKSNVKIFINIK